MIFVMLTWIEEEPIHLNPSDIIKDGKFLPYGVETDDKYGVTFEYESDA